MTNLGHLPLLWAATLGAILFAAGMTKGVIGIGLPIVAVPLLSLVVPLPSAVAIVAIPLILTNLAQAYAGDPIAVALKALWPVLAGTAVGLIVGVQLLTGLSPEILKPVVGTVLFAVAVLMLLAPKVNCPDRFAPMAGPLVGVGGGMLGGLAGQPGPIVFLCRLSRGINGGRFGLIDSKHRDSLASYQMWEAGDERREDVGIALGCGDGAGGVSRRAGWGSSGASAGDLAAAVGGGGVGGGAGERV